jgi:basic membrane protein A
MKRIQRVRLHARRRNWLVVPLVLAIAGLLAGCGGSNKSAATSTTTPTTTGSGSGLTAALVSDIGKFTDKGFNQNQLKGLNDAKAKLGINTLALQSNSTSDYAPNFNTAIRKGAKLVIAAGFLLAPTQATFAKKFPNVDFAITDYTVHTSPFADKKGNVLPAFKNVQGLTYNANESGCLVGVLAAKMAQKMGGNTIGAVGGLKIPPVDIWIAGYRYCAQKAVPGTKVLVQYSNDFVATDKCQTVAQNEISQGAKVLFQVAGGCGLGTLKAAADAKLWGIGVDVDQYNDSPRVLTSGVKRVDTGVFDAIQQAKAGKFKGGSDLVFDLKNGGMGVGKISPAVPGSFIALMNAYRAKIIAGTLKVPTGL